MLQSSFFFFREPLSLLASWMVMVVVVKVPTDVVGLCTSSAFRASSRAWNKFIIFYTDFSDSRFHPTKNEENVRKNRCWKMVSFSGQNPLIGKETLT